MKTVVITGGSGDIGLACCKAFVSKGYNVVATYFNNKDNLPDLSENCPNGNLTPVYTDVSKPEDVSSLFKSAIDTYGSIDILVNCAAVSVHGLIQDTENLVLDNIVDVNVKGVFYACREAVKYMVANHSGSIINITSMWGETGASCEVAYSMTKAAVTGLTKALAKEVGPSGIRVNCVSPGLIDTKMNDVYTKEDLDAICEETPLMRIGRTDDVSDAVMFLAEDSASFITGQVLSVNGGYVI